MDPFSWSKRKEAPDTLAHLYLNLGSASSWANFGYWKNTKDYPTAAGNLARLLGNAAALSANDRVLDLGCGCGDQLEVWNQIFGVPSNRIVAINSSREQVSYAEKKWRNRLPFLDLRFADAASLSRFPSDSYDKILCLDSAYFFRDRKKFIQETFRILKPGGKFCSAELVFSTAKLSWKERLERNILSFLAGIPASNRFSYEELAELHAAQGLKQTSFEILDETVFGGFAEFLQKVLPRMEGIPSKLAARYIRFGEFLASEKRRKFFHYVLYTLEK
ncbi:class I SAM-dependent methyltransferase [Leptospira fletcheri]|uniref:Class I SAM-dependent methyltransferase n=1 Tax=Leptospira fletcheri TaxID=2484981 RepID=A0A4R9GH51_9LEPT|nr:class I SAM-dependent methyltransferase [Leptospira fletcheri]TGK12028.1 class I SAM-dependent methyltransferase [Leptospira fletcheri]